MADNEKIYKKNSLMLQGFEYHLPIQDGFYKEKHFWKYLEDNVDYFAGLGVTRIWLPPAYKGEKGFNSVGYDVYDRYDLGEFEKQFMDNDSYAKLTEDQKKQTRYGLIGEYKSCIRAFQAKGIEVICDIVMNHMMGGEEKETVTVEQYDMNDRKKKVSEVPFEIEAWTVFNYPGRNGKYSDDTWNHEDFNAVDYDDKRKNGNDPQLFLFKGKQFNKDVDYENGNYDYLMGCNIDMNNDNTVEKLYRWACWYLEETGADGFRLDAVKHISSVRMQELIRALRTEKGNDFYVVGEYWSHELVRLDKYLSDVGRDKFSLFDVPLHYALRNASVSSSHFDMRTLLNYGLFSNRPDDAVTFVDNHDTQPQEALASWVLPWFKQQAYSLILFQKSGLPCVFYGDLYGMEYTKNGVHVKENPVADLDLMCLIRRECAYGEQLNYYNMDSEFLSPEEEQKRDQGDPEAMEKWNRIVRARRTNAQVIGYTRAGYPRYHNSGMAVLVTNGTGGSFYMYINKRYAGKTFINALAPADEKVTLNEKGMGNFYVKDGKAAVWIRETAYTNIRKMNRKILDGLLD